MGGKCRFRSEYRDLETRGMLRYERRGVWQGSRVTDPHGRLHGGRRHDGRAGGLYRVPPRPSRMGFSPDGACHARNPGPYSYGLPLEETGVNG